MRTIVMLDEQGGKIIDHITHTRHKLSSRKKNNKKNQITSKRVQSKISFSNIIITNKF